MTSPIRLKSFCPHLGQRCWSGGPLVFTPKTRRSALAAKVFRARLRETEAPSYLPRRLYRPFHRARAGFQIALRSTPRRLKTQDT